MSVPNRGPELLGVNVAFIATAITAYLLRCFVRVKMVKAFGFDDWLMGLALLFFIFYMAASTTGIHYGTGRHHRDLSAKQIETAKHCWWFCYLFYSISMICCKLSIGCLLLRISIKRIHTWILYLAMLTSVVAGLAFFFIIVFQCSPVDYFYKKDQPGTCINNDVIVALGYTYSIFSIVTDFTFSIIPGFLVWDLQLKRRAKVALIPLITMGCIASAAVIARLPFIRFFNSPDFLWATTDIAIWSTIEQGLAITAGSLATLRPLFFLAMRHLGLTTSPTGQRPSYGGKSNPLAMGSNHKSNQKSESLRPDMFKLSTVVETRRSHDSGPSSADFPKSPNWYNNSNPHGPSKEARETKKYAKKGTSDNESQKSLKISSDDDDQMHIMVSKTFYITDEERSLAPRDAI